MNVGIDLGTTYSLVARLDADAGPILLPDQNDRDALHTPSVVYVSQPTSFVGQLAEVLAEQEPDRPVLRFFKRHFGSNKPIHYDGNGTAWHAESLGALVLKKLRYDAEAYTGSRVDGAVITVPAHFNDLQRRAVIAAASLAELPVLDLLEEPVAAALHYGIANRSENQVLVAYDFGGGTFDASVLSMTRDGVFVLAKDGITELGGKEVDERIGEMVLSQFSSAGIEVQLTARTLLQLRRLSEQLKIALCTAGTEIVREIVLLGSAAVEVCIHRDQFERAIGDLLERTMVVTKRCLEGAGIRPADANAVLLIGGSSMIPSAVKTLRAIFNAPGQRVLFHEPTKAVAFGAALRAAQITGSESKLQIPPELRGVSGYNVGIRTIDPVTRSPRIDTLIKKNLPLPARARRTYYTHRADQTRIVVDVVQYLEASDTPVTLGQLTVGPIASPRVNYPVDIALENREDGTIAVQAYDPQTGVEIAHVIERDREDPVSYLAPQRTLVRSTLINNL